MRSMRMTCRWKWHTDAIPADCRTGFASHGLFGTVGISYGMRRDGILRRYGLPGVGMVVPTPSAPGPFGTAVSQIAGVESCRLPQGHHGTPRQVSP